MLDASILGVILVATLPPRVFALWIPMGSGLWLARREMVSMTGGGSRGG